VAAVLAVSVLASVIKKKPVETESEA
jgi:hypothetical protein